MNDWNIKNNNKIYTVSNNNKVKEKKKKIEKKNEREVKVVVRDKMEKLY